MASEGLLLYRMEEGHPLLWLLAAATAGNVLGSMVNYGLGMLGADVLERKKLVKRERLEQAHRLFEKYGPIALLLSWVPVIGDPITFAAGVGRFSFLWFFLLVLAAKGGRYLFLAAGWGFLVNGAG